MHILTFHFIFSVQSKPLPPNWAGAVLYGDVSSQGENLSMTYLWRKIENFLLLTLPLFLCSILTARYLKILLLAQ